MPPFFSCLIVVQLGNAREQFGGHYADCISLDTSTPNGKMVFTVLGAVAELERSLIVERVKAWLRNALAQGKRV